MLTKYLKPMLAMLATLVLLASFARAVEPEHALSGFAWMLGGEWKSGSSVQVFEWGLDKRTVRASSYVISDGKRVLVSEGLWYWHPGEKVIKGIFVAKGMPFYMIESEAEFDGKRLIHRLKTFSEHDGQQMYVEVLEPESGDVFSWRLFAGKSINGKPLMSDKFQRSP